MTSYDCQNLYLVHRALTESLRGSERYGESLEILAVSHVDLTDHGALYCENEDSIFLEIFLKIRSMENMFQSSN